MALVSVVRWAMLVVLAGVVLLAAEGRAAPGEAREEPGSAATLPAEALATAEGAAPARARRSTAAEAEAAPEGDEEGSEYNNDEPEYDEDEGTGEEEEESSPLPPPTFLSAPLTLNLRPGDNVSLPCRVDGVGKFVQMWLNGSQTITVRDQILGDSRVHRLPDMSLFIESVRPEDSGAYTCQIVSHPIANLTHYVKVPEPAKIVDHSGKTAVIAGQSLTLHCTVKGSPRPAVTWTLQNRTVPDATYSEDGSVLTINPVSKHHAGQYQCVADNKVGNNASVTMMVSVSTKPQVTVRKDMVFSGEGETVELECTVSGQPKPQLIWYKEGVAVEMGSSRFQVSAVNNTYTLRIRYLEKTDFGSYSCNAKNKNGVRQKIIILTGKPDTPKYIGQQLEDNKIVLEWDVESSAPIQAHELRYRERGTKDWIKVVPAVKDADGNIYRVAVDLPNLPTGDYEAVFRTENEFGSSESQPVEFKGSEKHNTEDESPSIEAKPAAETSKRGPDGGDNGATACSLSSLAAAFVSTLVFITMSNHL